jgi:hypothetical protein
MDLDDRPTAIRFLIRDRDTKFVGPFDEVFRSEGARVILTPSRAPQCQRVSPRDIRRGDLLGGLIHEYYGRAASANLGF